MPGKRSKPMFRFYPQDFIIDCELLDLEERGALLTIAAYCWQGSVEKHKLFDSTALARLLRISPRKASTLMEPLQQFFQAVEGDPDRVIPKPEWMEIVRVGTGY